MPYGRVVKALQCVGSSSARLSVQVLPGVVAEHDPVVFDGSDVPRL
jgi:hypothetical protein